MKAPNKAPNCVFVAVCPRCGDAVAVELAAGSRRSRDGRRLTTDLVAGLGCGHGHGATPRCGSGEEAVWVAYKLMEARRE